MLKRKKLHRKRKSLKSLKMLLDLEDQDLDQDRGPWEDLWFPQRGSDLAEDPLVDVPEDVLVEEDFPATEEDLSPMITMTTTMMNIMRHGVILFNSFNNWPTCNIFTVLLSLSIFKRRKRDDRIIWGCLLWWILWWCIQFWHWHRFWIWSRSVRCSCRSKSDHQRSMGTVSQGEATAEADSPWAWIRVSSSGRCQLLSPRWRTVWQVMFLLTLQSTPNNTKPLDILSATSRESWRRNCVRMVLYLTLTRRSVIIRWKSTALEEVYCVSFSKERKNSIED